jgi:hypothetical protein
LLLSCRKENALDCFKSNGKDITVARHTEAFDYIEAYDNLEVTIIQANEYKVEVTAGEHIINNISTKVSEGILKLDNTNKCNFVRGYKRKIKITVTVPRIVKITNHGVGPVTVDKNYKQDKIFLRAENSGDIYLNGSFTEVETSSHGNGDMYLSGDTKRLLIYSNGTNYTYAEGMKVSDFIFISTYSFGNAYFNLNGLSQIDYMIWSGGNIYYKGEAAIMRDLSEISAKGKAIKE